MGYKLFQVSELAEQVRGVTYSKSDASLIEKEGCLPILRANNITDTGLVLDKFVYVPRLKISDKQLLQEGDIVVAASSGSIDVVGKAAPLTEKFTGSFGAFCKVVRPNSKIHPTYLSHFFKTEKYRSIISALAAGANINNLRNEHIDTLKIPLPMKNGKPDLLEQQRIAGILDQADAIRRKRQQALQLTDDFLRATFLDLFGDPVTNPKGWDECKIGDVEDFITSGSRGWAKYYSDSGAFFIRIQNLKNGVLDLQDVAYVNAPNNQEAIRTSVKAGDILLSITADLGRVAVVPDDLGQAHINQHLSILRLNDINSVYAAHYLASAGGGHQFAAFSRRGVKAGLNFTDIRNLTLLRPPLDLQNEYQKIVEFHLKRINSQKHFIAQSDDLFASLQQRAFKGEL
ncbi:restriction endonuclease subunit S [Coraliomargarita sp. SDUM461004]|uniref:Restriction endonuclease subunit S n=1 Tax=Thalassobacterium sedimentorum TaxID=3041258 RepID=A0ABU1ALN8_9BACT|nr:restriction endonuclease subunit S [Coraliomargarita sp. SDUM461004]MDQ8195123.1 restriction endonuclease subunit S [Coraliomargarita sp. SDUM461004]